MNTSLTELEAFRHFIDTQVQIGEVDLSPEAALNLFRAQQISPDQFQRNVAAIKESIADMEAGEIGRPAREVIAELRAKHGLSKSP